MPKRLSQLLRRIIDHELPDLRNLKEPAVSVRPRGPGSWSPKEELGHLIDSAANNHIRFVRAALEAEYRGPGYAQNDWVGLHGYQEMPWETIVDLWFGYNSLLAVLIARIPPDRGTSFCYIGAGEAATLAFVIEDYIVHLQHHVDHLLARTAVTPYPSALDRSGAF